MFHGMPMKKLLHSKNQKNKTLIEHYYIKAAINIAPYLLRR